MKLSINENIINKGDPRTRGWKNIDFNIDQLIDHIVKRGCAWSPGILSEGVGDKKPTASDISGAIILAVDIDNSIKTHDKASGKYNDRVKTLAEGYLPLDIAIADPWLRSNAIFLYETPSSTDDWNRFRIVFLLPELISKPEEYSEIASAFIEKFGADKSCKNIDRFFFGCKNAKFEKFSENPINPKVLESVLNGSVEEESEINEYKTHGSNGDLTSDQVSEMLKYIDGESLSYDEWFRILSAIGNYFDESTAVNLIENWSPDKSVGTQYKIKHRASKPGIGSVVYFAKRAGFDTKSFYKNLRPKKSTKSITSQGRVVDNSSSTGLPLNCIFWYEEQIGIKAPKYILHIMKSKFINFLTHVGFYKYWLNASVSTYVKVENSIVEEITSERILDIVHYFIDELSEEITEHFTNQDLWEKLLQKIHLFVNKEFLNALPSLEDNFITDTKDKSYVFFKNNCVEITESGAKVLDYKDLKGYIWKDQIINHEIKLYPYNEAFDTEFTIFGKLIERICSTANIENPTDRSARVIDEKRLYSLISAIGYLLHTYKDATITKAVIFCEEKIAFNDESNGRSGKGLVAHAIGLLRKRVVFNGKQLDFQDKFLFQRVTKDTQLLYFDDTKKGFNFESLFSILTEGLIVEKKGLKSFDIPFSKSPKVLISTNSVMANDSDSYRARKFEIEFSDYFSADYTPFHEFDQLLFDQGWTPEDPEWDKFYSFMIYCIQFYLESGLLEYEQKNLKERKLLDTVPEEFLDFANDYLSGFQSGDRIFKDEVYEKFIEKNKIFAPNGKKAISQRTTSKFLSAILKFNNVGFSEDRIGTKSERKYFYKLD